MHRARASAAGSGRIEGRIIESLSDGLWAIDLTGRTLYANPKAALLLGRKPEELMTMSVHDVLDEAGQAQLDAHLAEVRRSGPKSEEVECCYLRKDGSPIWLILGETGLYDDAGELVGIIHRLTSDEERQHLIRELSRNRQQLAEAESLARLGSWAVELPEERISWSDQLYEIFGLDPATYTPTRAGFLDRIAPSDLAAVTEAVQRGQETGDFQFEAQIVRPDGSVRWVRGLGRAQLWHEDGSPKWMVGTIQDVTESKLAELKLLDQVVINSLMQVLAGAANQAATLDEALVVTRDLLLGHDDWQRATAFTVTADGLAHRRLPGEPASTAPQERERTHAERVLASPEVVFEETEVPQAPLLGFVVREYGEPVVVVVAMACSPFERHDMLRSLATQVAGQLGRVAERERVARALASARDEAMEASSLKSSFLATMSHEIRTPLNGVIGLNDLLLGTELDHEQRRLAQGMQSAGRSLLALLNDILDFSKIEAGALELEVVDFNVRQVFEEAVAIVGSAAADKGLALGLDIDAAVPSHLRGDPARLGQITANLLANAVKFTHEGSVTISVSGAAQDDGGFLLRVDVTDTGIGVSPAQRTRLFQPFRQADASTTRTFGGTGLGLAISHQLVRAIGGEIGVTSCPGSGSTFWFTGLFAPAVHQGLGVRSVQDRGQALGAGHVLVVEDNDINQLVARGMLQSLGYTSDVADDGVEGVRMAAAGTYDAILMDLQMPRLDGYAATRLIRQREGAGPHVPIIAMTAAALQGEREKCLAAGMDDFLTKPIQTERVATVLAAMMAEPATVRPSSVPAPRAAPSDPVVLDLSRLEELEEMGEAALPLIHRAVDNFVAGAESSLQELHVLLDRRDPDQLMAAAHKLKGSALNLGALAVAEASLALEQAGRSGDLSRAPALLDALAAALHTASEALAAYRAQWP